MTRADRRRDRDRRALVSDLAAQWRDILAGTTASRTVVNAGGSAVPVVPKVVDVRLGGPGDPLVLVVRLLPGQLPADVAAVSDRIAEHMGAAAVRIEPFRPGFALVRLLARDPLTTPLDLPIRHVPGAPLLGVLENGADLRVPLVDWPHVVVQGATRSGKSWWAYAVLGQLAGDPLVRVAGVDPSGLLLRPWTIGRHAPWVCAGLADLTAVEATLTALVAEMDRRLAAMPADQDVTVVSDTTPLVLAVFDEYVGLLRAVDAADPKMGKRVRALVARLLAESHKTAMRVVLLTQRAEAAVIGAAERAQCAGRLSFRVDGLDAVKLLHADAEAYATAHVAAPPGVALLSWPGQPLTRVRAPGVTSYGDYARSVLEAL